MEGTHDRASDVKARYLAFYGGPFNEPLLDVDFDIDAPEYERIEKLQKYMPGGYHPTMIGDTFQDGRYKIVHKLGHGGFSTVWMARDNQQSRYVALKILSAEASCESKEAIISDHLAAAAASTGHPGSKYVSLLLDQFRIEGSNGSHLCFVSEVLGPPLSQLGKTNRKLRGSVARQLGLQLAQCIAFIHSQGVCHGGRNPSPIL